MSTAPLVSTVLLLAIGWWFAVKVLYLVHSEYTSDLFTLYQLSTGWLEGKPLLYENCFGFHDRLHNYYLSPLLGFLTLPLGVSGLFVFQALLLLAATATLFVVALVEQRFARWRWWLGFGLVFWFGPISFYVWDDPITGWHMELLYPALAVLYAIALRARRWPWAVVSGMLLLLCKEDAAVLACCVGLASVLLAPTTEPVGLRPVLRRSARFVTLWGSLFLLGLVWLQYKNDFAGGHLAEALGAVRGADPRDLLRYLGVALGWLVLLAAPALTLLLALIPARTTLKLGLISLPIVVVNVISGLWYYPELYYGPGWAPRVATLWGYWLSCLVLAALHDRPEDARPQHGRARWLPRFGLALLLQFVALWTVSEPYSPVTRCYVRPLALLFGSGDDRQLAFMNRIGEQLPRGYPLAPPGEYFGAFRRQEIFWWDHPQERSWPELFICRGPCDVRFRHFDWTGKTRFTLGEFEFVADAERERLIRAAYLPF